MIYFHQIFRQITKSWVLVRTVKLCLRQKSQFFLFSSQNRKVSIFTKISKCVFSLTTNSCLSPKPQNIGSLPNFAKASFSTKMQNEFSVKTTKLYFLLKWLNLVFFCQNYKRWFPPQSRNQFFFTKSTKTSFRTKIDKFCYPIKI